MNSNEKKHDINWELFVNALSTPILILSTDGKILYANQAACEYLEVQKNQMTHSDFFYPVSSEKKIEVELYISSDNIKVSELTSKKIKWKKKEAWVITLNDITQRKKTENLLKISANVFKYAKEGIVITDKDKNIININQEFTKITAYQKEDVLGKHIRILQSGQHSHDFYEAMWRQIKEQGYWYGEIWDKKKTGEPYPQVLAISAIFNDDNQITNYVGIFYDITQQELQKKQLEYIAYHDSLTKLPNRVGLTQQLEEAITHANRLKQKIGILFIDVDDFKQINDRLGHSAGDIFLIKFSMHVKKILRKGDIFARYGGDEFILITKNIESYDHLNTFIQRIYHQLETPIMLNATPEYIHVSIGATIYPQHKDLSSEQLIRQADHAMYKSKMAGKRCARFFDEKQDSLERKKNKNINQLQEALKNGELLLYYQPKVNLETNQAFAVEALLRWQHPDRGLLIPGQFLPPNLCNAFILDLTDWTLKQAVKQLAQWQKIGIDLSLSVNIDAYRLEQDDFLDKLNALIKGHKSQIRHRLELEILETSLVSKPNRIKEIIKACQKLGIGFSLDDFGTGFASIHSLLNFSFQYMKIDQHFVKSIPNNPRDQKILKAILDIASAASISVIAEGVETLKHATLLLKLGCHLGQGFAFSKALHPKEFEQWYASNMNAQ
ncbi:MAG: EAL domain-containing protein [Legionellaceae bacterium]|nr:EAL domain-containing protein [Legionellaceae bacterium]